MIKNRENIIYQAVIAGELEIDSEGRIWRVKMRKGCSRLGKAIRMKLRKARAEHENPYGYLVVSMLFDGIQYTAQASRLVCRHFYDIIPKGLTVNHKDGDKKNNNPSNLELMTHSEQVLHAIHVLKVGRIVDQWGEKNLSAKVTDEQVIEIIGRRKTGEKLKAISEDFGISPTQVSRIARRKSRKKVDYVDTR